MGKITGLPATTALTGAEHLPIVQNGETKRATMAALRDQITPYLQQWYKGEPGNTGPANNTVASLEKLADAAVTDLSATVRGIGTFTFVEGDFAALIAAQPADYRASNRVANGAWVREPGAAGFPSLASIEATTFTPGQVFRSSLYDGSVWRVRPRVELQPDYFGTIDNGGDNTSSSVVNFTDELHVVVALAGGGTGIAECRLGSIMGFLRRRVAELRAVVRARLDQAASLPVALSIAMLGDSITFGQWGQNGAEVPNGAIARTGDATGYGDGSIHRFDQLPTTIPQAMQATGEAIYGAGKVTVLNRGYSGDRSGSGYRRHRVHHGCLLSYIGYLANEVIYATNNGGDQTGIFQATAVGTPNDRGGFILANYAPTLLKVVAREILRGTLPVLWGIGPFRQNAGYDGTDYATARMLAYYMQAMREVGEKLDLIVVDGAEIGGDYPLSVIMQNDAHPNVAGARIYATRMFAPLLAIGCTPCIRGDEAVPANIMTRPWQQRLNNAKSKVPNSGSFGAPFFTATEGCDIILTDAGDTVWLGIYTEADDIAVMPVGNLSNGAITYDLDLGIAQGGRVLRTDAIARPGEFTAEPSSKTIATTKASLKLTTPACEAGHLVIARRGWHILRIRRDAGTFTFSGVKFFRDPLRWQPLELAPGFTAYGKVRPAWAVQDSTLVFRGTVLNADPAKDTKMFDLPVSTLLPTSLPGTDHVYHAATIRTVFVEKMLYWRNNGASGAGSTNLFNLANLRIPLLDLPA